MHQFILPFAPVPWASHGGYGKKSYNPRWRERACFRNYLRNHFRGECIKGYVRIRFEFYFAPPRSFSRRKQEEMVSNLGYHKKRPDLSNLVKFTEDCLKGIVVEDDNQVVEIMAIKRYDFEPRVVIFVEELGTS